MLKEALPDPDMTMDDLMRTWPCTIAVVLRYRMLCVGCPVGPFHTIAEACRAHRLDQDAFVREIAAEIERRA